MSKKILLLGEYSGVHTKLAKALRDRGYDVTLIHDGDGFKGFKADYILKYERWVSKYKFINYIYDILLMVMILTGVNGIVQIFKHFTMIRSLKNYDVVQLINPIFLNGFGSIVNLLVFIYLRKNNKKVFLCAVGDDYYWVNYCLKKMQKYSMFDNFKLTRLRSFFYSLKYKYAFLYPFLNKFMVRSVDGVLPGSYDYYQAYKYYNTNCTQVVPYIMNLGEEDTDKKNNKVIKIFHGRQIGSAYRKGDYVFLEAIGRIKEKYNDLIEYIEVSNVPYDVYINLFKDCDVFIDQCYSYDCGVNALLGMSNGKVVFSGFEEETKMYYNIDFDPLINATPNPNDIYTKLELLIENRDLIDSYRQNGLKFIQTHCNEARVVGIYEKIWFFQ